MSLVNGVCPLQEQSASDYFLKETVASKPCLAEVDPNQGNPAHVYLKRCLTQPRSACILKAYPCANLPRQAQTELSLRDKPCSFSHLGSKNNTLTQNNGAYGKINGKVRAFLCVTKTTTCLLSCYGIARYHLLHRSSQVPRSGRKDPTIHTEVHSLQLSKYFTTSPSSSLIDTKQSLLYHQKPSTQ